MLLVCGFMTAHALESDDINTAILVEGSVPPTWTNDPDHPWYIVQNSDGSSYIRTPETPDDSNFNSTLSFSYTSSYPAEITFRSTYNPSRQYLVFKIDGEVKELSYTYYYGYYSFRFMVPNGEHTIEFIFIQDNGYTGDYAEIYDLKIWECKELESACLKEGSLPITFENDSVNMWITEDGYIRSQPIKEGITTKISTTFTIDKISLFSFEIHNLYDIIYTTVYIDNIKYLSSSFRVWENDYAILYPGTHTIEFESETNTDYRDCITEVRNVCLDQTWYEVNLNNPGELGKRLLEVLGDKTLEEVELLKIKGELDSEDWTVVQMLSKIKAIDFTETNTTEIPDKAMQGLSQLWTVMLPKTLTKIGDEAFFRTNLYEISIPATVESIGRSVWSSTQLRYITFDQNSKLSKIGCGAFGNTNLIDFIMPDSVTDLEDPSLSGYGGMGLFNSCTSLRRLHLSDNLTAVPSEICFDCWSLEEVNLPSNARSIGRRAFYNSGIKSLEIPSSVTTIREEAFARSALQCLHLPSSIQTLENGFAASCDSLKEVSLSPHCWDMDSYFNGCNSLEKIVLPCATPPTIISEPFDYVNKANITLYVPDFAFNEYRVNLYWHNFTSTVISDEISVNDYWAIRGNLTLDSNHVMRNVPSVDLMRGGTLIMDSDALQNFNTFTYNTSESSPASYLSKSDKVTANKLEARFYVRYSNTWHFFSPVTDVKMRDITYPSTESWVIRYYDGARRANENTSSGNWVNVPEDGTLRRGQGYIIQARAAGWLNMPAANTTEHDKFFGSNEVTLPLEDNACETAANAGWNFVANPYPCYYDIYYIGMQAPITVWTGSTYRAYSLNDGDRGDDTFVLRPMQPFFVQKSNPDLTTVMPLMGRRTSSVINRNAPSQTKIDPNRHKLNLELFSAEKEEADDYTRIVLNENADEAYETSCDASKFMSLDNNVAQIYSLGEKQHPMAINERPYVDGNVALGVYLPVSGERYTIAARRADRKAWIYDAVTGIEHDLTLGDYFFTANKAGIDNSRFTIRFAPTTVIEDVDATVVKVSGHRGYIEVNAPEESNIAVYSTDGTMVANVKAENGLTEIPATAGIYIVKVNGMSVKTIVK